MIYWDVFISHAYEDKAAVARPLADKLASNGLTVWLDEAEIFVGDSLRAKIDEGLNRSQFGVVILSPNFFAKNWPKSELDGLLSRETDGKKVVLPVWHNLGIQEIRSYSAILAGRAGVSTSLGLDSVAKQIIQTVTRTGRSRATGRPIYAGKLTKKVLFELPVGSILITNTVNPSDLLPTWTEELGLYETREALWDKLRAQGETGRKCYVFADMANMRAHLADRHKYVPEPSSD